MYLVQREAVKMPLLARKNYARTHLQVVSSLRFCWLFRTVSGPFAAAPHLLPTEKEIACAPRF
jgi:hypothetical protein